MGFALVVDTNVFLLASEHRGCAEIANHVCFSSETMLAIDGSNEIRKEYKLYASRYPKSRLGQLMQLLIEREQAGALQLEGEQSAQLLYRLLPLRCNLTDEEKDFLLEKGCSNPIEPQLFAIARNQPHTFLVIPEDSLAVKEEIKRGYRQRERLEELRALFHKTVIVHTDDTSWLYTPGDPAPRDLETLKAFLEGNRLDENSVEREFIEVKCPEGIEYGINGSLVKKIMHAICALTNSVSGYIFVGVKDDGTILGVPKKYNGQTKSSWDELWRTISSSELSQFRPRKPILRQWFIPVSEDYKVVAIRVVRQEGGWYSYRKEVFVREGTSSHRINAVSQ